MELHQAPSITDNAVNASDGFDAADSDAGNVYLGDKASRRAYCKKMARQALLCRDTGNLLTFELAALMLLLVTVAVKNITESFFTLFETYAISTAAAQISGTISGVEAVAESMITFALILPVFCGCFTLARSMLDNYAECGGAAQLGGGRSSLGEIFSAFSSGGEYFRTLRTAFCYIWRWGLFCVAFVLAIYVARFAFNYTFVYYGYYPALLLTLAIMAAAVILSSFCVILLMRRFPTLYISRRYPSLKPRDAAKLAAKVMKGEKCDCVKLILSFFGWFALSLLTFGAALVIYVLPYFVLTLEYYAGLLCDEYGGENI